jgi:hypothetical protein
MKRENQSITEIDICLAVGACREFRSGSGTGRNREIGETIKMLRFILSITKSECHWLLGLPPTRNPFSLKHVDLIIAAIAQAIQPRSKAPRLRQALDRFRRYRSSRIG